MQTFELANFGPIREVALPVQDLMLLIGPQASGKSTISKAIYFFKSLKDDLIVYLLNSIDDNTFDKPVGTFAKRLRKKFLDFWGSSQHLDQFHLKYHYSDSVSITIGVRDGFVNPDFSQEFKARLFDIVAIAQNFSKKVVRAQPRLSSAQLLQDQISKQSFFKTIRQRTNELFSDYRDMVFIPAGRSLLATLSDHLQVLPQYSLDFLMRAFLERINSTKNTFGKSLSDVVIERKKLTQTKLDFELLDEAENLIGSILKGTYIHDRQGDKIFFKSGKYVKLNHASSGQQESIWILLSVFELLLGDTDVFMVVEEPEAHLYPEAQVSIVELLALFSNYLDNQLIVTTHSPYILSAFNNLLYSHQVGEMSGAKARSIVSKRKWIAPARSVAFYVDDGHVTPIVDEESGLVMSEAIDQASAKINETYEKLYELEANNVQKIRKS